MKKIISIFLLVVICITHLNIVDTVTHFSARCKTGLFKGKELPAEKETGKETDGDAKEKSGGDEKIMHKSQFTAAVVPGMFCRQQHISCNTILQSNPCCEKVLQPPRAACCLL